jgi:hypothetical protein
MMFSMWIWAAVGAAAVIAILLALPSRNPQAPGAYVELPGDDAFQRSGRSATGEDSYLNRAAQAGLPDAAAGSLRLLLAAAPRYSGPAPAGWASGLGQPNFTLVAAGGDPLRDQEDGRPAAPVQRPGSGAIAGFEVDNGFAAASPTHPGEPVVETTQTVYQVPAGKYATLIMGAHGRAPRSAVLVELQRYGDKFPVSAGPGTTYFIGFPEGWEVKENEARVVITSTSSPGAAASSADGFAWGVTARGPVAFPEQAKP